MVDDRALLIALPLRHLEAVLPLATPTLTLPAGGPGDLDSALLGTPVYVIATDAGDAEVPAATWRARFVRRVVYAEGSPWPVGLPPTWLDEHPSSVVERPSSVVERPSSVVESPSSVVERSRDLPETDEDDEWDWDDGGTGPQSFLEVTDLELLPREDWVFTNELVPKQARRGRAFLPRVPTLVDLPD